MPHRGGGVPPRGHLDRVDIRECVDEFVVKLEAVHGRAQVEPVGGLAERVQRHLVPAVEQAVEVLEDVAVPAAHAGALGHVYDAQRPGLGAHRARVEELPPALPEQPLGGELALAERSAARDGLVVDEPGGGEVHDAEARLPRAQAPVDVLVGHRVTLVEQPHALDHHASHVHTRPRHRQRRPRLARRPPAHRLEAVAVVEPLGGVEVAHRPAELDAPVGIQKLGSHDADVVLLRGGVLQARQPSRPRLHVGVQHDDVAVLRGGAQATVDVGGEARVCGALDDLDPRDRPQRGEVLGATRVVGDDQARHPARDRPADALHECRHPVGVAETRDHHVDGPTVLAIPSKRAAHLQVTRLSAQPQPVPQRREAQRKRERSEQQRSPPVVAIGEIDAPAHAGERSAEAAVERARGDRLRRGDRALLGLRGFFVRGGKFVGHGAWSFAGDGSTRDRSLGASRSSAAKPPRRSSDRRRRTAAGSRSAREPSIAPVWRATW